jgi:hypothetical protein
MIITATIETAAGIMTAAAVDEGICLLEFVSGTKQQKNSLPWQIISGQQYPPERTNIYQSSGSSWKSILAEKGRNSLSAWIRLERLFRGLYGMSS